MVFYNPNLWYINSANYAALPKRQASFSYVVGEIVRQGIDAAVGSERAFICGFAGTTDVAVDATWVLTRGALTNDGTVRWYECTGQASMCGDVTSTLSWTQARAVSTGASLGAIIKRNNGASYQLCTTAGNMGASEPAFSDTAGITVGDSTIVWTSLGPVGNYTKGKAPIARLASVFGTNWYAPDDVLYVSANHSEIQPAQSILPPNANRLLKILCHDHVGNYPPIDTDLRTTAVIASSQSISNSFRFLTTAMVYVYGVNFKVAMGGSLGGTKTAFGAPNWSGNYVQNWLHLENCSFEMGESSTGNFVFGDAGVTSNLYMVWKNTTVKFNNAQQFIHLQNVTLIWQNTLGAVLGPTFPSALFRTVAGSNTFVAVLDCVDLSTLATAIYGYTTLTSIGSITLKDCKLNSSMTVPALASGLTVRIINSDAGIARLNTAQYDWLGTDTTNNTVLRTGQVVGPREFLQSRKIVTTDKVQWVRPFRAQPFLRWNDKLNVARTVTVYGVIQALTVPLNDEVWLEINYLGSSSYPKGSVYKVTKANYLSTGVPGIPDGSAWSATGVGWTPFLLTASFTSRMAGEFSVAVLVAKRNATLHIDPVMDFV